MAFANVLFATESEGKRPGDMKAMNAEYQVQKSGLAGINWITVCRGDESKARQIFERQLQLYSVGRFRLVDARGQVLEERRAELRFFAN